MKPPNQPAASGSGLWDAAYRPFFALTGCMAIGAGIAWCLALLAGGAPDVARYHAPVLVTGFIGSAVAGYLLTAQPGWTGRDPVTGTRLGVLVTTWFVGQVSVWLPLAGFSTGVSGASMLFPVFLGAVLIREFLAAQAFAKIWVTAFPAGLTAYSWAFATDQTGWVGQEQTAMLALMLGLSAIGGRMICAFGGSHLLRCGHTQARAQEARDTAAATIATAAVAAAFAVSALAEARWAGLALAVAGLAQLWVPLIWLTRPIWNNALFAMLPIAYLWLPVGLVALGLLRAGVPLGSMTQTDALHGLTMGAAACMIAAVAGRAAARRQAGALRARPVQILAFAAIWLAAATRFSSGLVAETSSELILASALLWTLGWTLWLVALIPALIGPVRRPALSAARAQGRGLDF